MDTTKIIIAQIEKFLTFLKSLDESDFSAIENGNQKIIFSFDSKKGASGSNKKLNELTQNEIISIYEKLNLLENRDAGFELIQDLNKTNIEKLCKMAELSITKKDSIKTLKNKLIEGTIGFRLNSKAIQQIN